MRKLVLFIFTLTYCLGFGQGIKVRWNNEASDTTRITQLLNESKKEHFTNLSNAAEWFGLHFVNTPYVAHTLEGDEECLTINLDELDCTTFVDICLALAYTKGEGRESWRDFVYNLKRMRYRNGEINGYSSRLHYICDWVIDNVHRGNIEDVARDIPYSKYMIRTIDFMSSNRDKYPALADSAEFARIRSIENAYVNHRFPYIKTSDLSNKNVLKYLRAGDVLAFVSNLKNLDVTHLGLLVKCSDGEFHVLHASSVNGKVEISDIPLYQFVKRNPRWIGVRVLRVKY